VALVSALCGVVGTGIRNAAEIRRLFATAPPLKTVFPETGLGNQLKQVAQLLTLLAGLRRQAFFVSHGGYDNHSNLLNLLPLLDERLNELSPALAAFYQATEFRDHFYRVGVRAYLRSFDNRGSYHAWGSHPRA